MRMLGVSEMLCHSFKWQEMQFSSDNSNEETYRGVNRLRDQTVSTEVVHRD